MVFKAQMQVLYPNAPEITFFQWSLFAWPLAVIMLILIWLGFCRFIIRNSDNIHFNMDEFYEQYRNLGPLSFAETVVLVDLGVMALLWFTRAGFGDSLPGWGVLFKDNVGDGTVAVLMSLVLFLVPSRSGDSRKRIMDWEALRDMSWGVLILLGGGFALAKGFTASGLSLWIGEALEDLDRLPMIFLIFSISGITCFATEFTSNVATANIVLPILASISSHIGVNPLLLMIPATLSSSYAFMFPVSTPPNVRIFNTNETDKLGDCVCFRLDYDT